MTAAARHTAGHTEGRRGASGTHTQKQATGTGRRKGTQQNTAEHSRRHTAATEHTTATEHTAGAGIGRTSGRKADRKEGERGADDLAPGEWWRRGAERRHGSREGTERADRKRVCNIFKGEKERKNTAETRKSM